MNRSKFFGALRGSALYSTLPQSAVDTLVAILNYGGQRVPLKNMAYIMATAYHEVGAELKPKTENLNYTSAARIRQVWPSRFKTDAEAAPFVRKPKELAMKVYGNRKDLGNTTALDGWTYRGRGLPQVTGKDNYSKASRLTGFDFISEPDVMVETLYAVQVMIDFMTGGHFTGKKLSDYTDYRNMRAVINGDVAANGAKVASYAIVFEKALIAGEYGKSDPVPLPVETKPVINDKPAAKPDEKPAEENKPSNHVPALVSLAIVLGFGLWGWLISLPCKVLGAFCGG